MITTNSRPTTLLIPRRIAAAGAFLLALSLAGLCSAAEVAFGGHYTVQLPNGWTSKLDPTDNTLGANGPGELTLNAMVATTETPPEALMEKIATRSTEKKAGYKLLEKGVVTSTSGHKAHMHRYQLAAKDGPQMWIDYYFQLTEKEVVVLVFAFPMNSSVPPKKEIQAMFDSVKVATTTSKEDSWLSKPAEKSQKPSKTSGGEDSDITGRYVKGSDYMELKGDGTFTFQMRGDSGAGTYTRKGATITFDFSGDKDDAKLDKDGFVDAQGGHWVKKP
jgi:hypothetical protein